MKWSPWHVRQLPIILKGVFAVIRASHFHTSYVRNWIFSGMKKTLALQMKSGMCLELLGTGVIIITCS